MRYPMPATLLALALLASPPAGAQDAPAPKAEVNCADRLDEDGDSVTDCEDSDCFAAPACKVTDALENTEVACSDWIDNDGDDAKDCDDSDCQAEHLKACKGSWQGTLDGTGAAVAARQVDGVDDGEVPALGDNMSVEDLLGRGRDADGERNEVTCSDGVDNDGDGAVDCADLGCRFDPDVTVCRGTPGLRFGVAAHLAHSYDFENEVWDTRVNRLQLRAFGPVPFIQDSFFLVQMRAERSPRLSFAFFSMPVPGLNGHFLNINSGGGGLSNALVLSVSKNILLDPAFYLTSAFEQGNGASLEMNGPLVRGLMDYRVFLAGGSGRFTGNIGGRFVSDDAEQNYAWGAGAQLALYLMGRFDRWDTRFLYTPVPTGLTFYLGARYDQRDYERFPAANANLLFRWKYLLAAVEGYGKREINFGSWQFAYNAQVGVLLVPKLLMLAADVGQFRASDFEENPNLSNSELRRLADEFTWRVALHAYVWRSTGLLSLLYTDRFVEAAVAGDADRKERQLRLEAQVRF